MTKLKWIENQFKHSYRSENLNQFSEEEILRAARFHSSIPSYQPTKLYSLNELAGFLGVKGIYVKDESPRFGLNAFKGLGATYAMAVHFSKKFNLDLDTTNFSTLSNRVAFSDKITFATATDGNHGKGVAWASRLFGQKAKVFMPKGSSQARLQAIKEQGAEATITELNYDDTVQMVADLAKKNGWVLVQDTSWEGYEEIPLAIMKGYLTIIRETMEQLKLHTSDPITHVFLQAGVGSFPATIAAAIYNLTAPASPKIIVVEPEKANCFYQSALNPSGEAKQVLGDLSTMMAGLACGKPNPAAWDLLKSLTSYFFSCEDSVSAKGMRVLGNPLNGDPKIISGESGAVPIGLLYEIMKNKDLLEAKNQLGLDSSSVIFAVSTEGDTDPVHYRQVVWDALT